MMTEEEVRLKCLEMAREDSERGKIARDFDEAVTVRAGRYLSFVMGWDAAETIRPAQSLTDDVGRE